MKVKVSVLRKLIRAQILKALIELAHKVDAQEAPSQAPDANDPQPVAPGQ